MAYIELDRLRLLHRSMNARCIDRCRFPFRRKHKEFDVFFFADTKPYELMFGLVRGQWSFLVEVFEGYRVKTRLGGDDYHGLCKALDLTRDRGSPFQPADFFNDLNLVVPSKISRDGEAAPQYVARYRRDVEEADKIYFVGWRPHPNPEIRDVTDRNLAKTRRLLGEKAYLHCKQHHISSAWTDDPRSANGSWRRLPPSPSDGMDTVDVETERAFKRAVAMGLSDLREGREISLSDARMRLGLS